MSFLFWYALFALTTSIASIYELVMPVMQRRKAAGHIIENEYIYYIIFLCLNVLAAPLVFLSCIIPSFSLRFQFTLEDSLFDKE